MPGAQIVNHLGGASKGAKTKALTTKAIEKLLDKGVFSSTFMRRVPYRAQIAMMAVELLTNGSSTFLDGREFKLGSPEYEDWLSLFRFVMGLMQDASYPEVEVNAENINIYKVYAGFNPDNV